MRSLHVRSSRPRRVQPACGECAARPSPVGRSLAHHGLSLHLSVSCEYSLNILSSRQSGFRFQALSTGTTDCRCMKHSTAYKHSSNDKHAVRSSHAPLSAAAEALMMPKFAGDHQRHEPPRRVSQRGGKRSRSCKCFIPSRQHESPRAVNNARPAPFQLMYRPGGLRH